MFKHRSNQSELMDDLSLSNDDLRKNLEELETYNQWLGGKKVLIKALDNIRARHSEYFSNNKIVIGDLGCGGGDLLRAINDWATSQRISVELIGIDANPFMTQYAAEKSPAYSNIHYKTLDIYSTEFAQLRFDILCLNSVCHHFSDDSLIELFQQLARQTRLAIIFNDLQRHWLGYFAIKSITMLFPFSALAKNDAPLSVLRAFRKQEIIALLEQAHLSAYQIRWAWAFRWDVIIWF